MWYRGKHGIVYVAVNEGICASRMGDTPITVLTNEQFSSFGKRLIKIINSLRADIMVTAKRENHLAHPVV